MNRRLAAFLLFMGERIRGEDLRGPLAELERTQWLSRDELADTQWKRLERLLQHAHEHSPFHRERMDAAGIHPEDIKSPADLRHIPVLTKQEFRENSPRIVARDRTRRVNHAKTSGSTGVPLAFEKDRTSFAWTLAGMYRGHRWHGVEPGAMEAMLWGVPVNPRSRRAALLRDFLLNRFREREYDLKPETLRAFHRELLSRRPEFLSGYASMVYQFANFVRQEGLPTDGLRLKMVKITSENLARPQRDEVEAVLGARTVSEYGAAETGLMAFECPAGNHHVMAESCFLEFVPVADAGPDVPSARIVATDLRNFACPVIRYDIGDLGEPDEKPCPCGRGLPVVKRILGRSSSIVRCPDGTTYHSIIFYYIMKGANEKFGRQVAQFRVVQDAIDHLTYQIVRAPGFSEECLDYVRRETGARFGEQMKVEFEFTDRLPREKSGKIRDFVSRIETGTADGAKP